MKRKRVLATMTALCMLAPMSTGVGSVLAAEDVKYQSEKDQEVQLLDDEGGWKFSFADVPENVWFEDAVDYVYMNGLMTGLNQTQFAPLQSLARAQFAVILHRMNQEPQIAYTNKFPDVPDGQWYTDAVLWANSIGVVKGYTDSKRFGTADNINREQMAVMMYRYAQYMKYDVSEKVDFSNFTDAYRVNDFAKEAMQWAVGSRMITGKNGNTKLDPQGSASRAECATIMMRFVEKYVYHHELEDTRWKDAYSFFISQEENRNYDKWDDSYHDRYKLIDINGDDIPELYIDHQITAYGSKLCTYYDGQMSYQQMGVSGLSYIEGENLFMDAGGHMDNFYNSIYRIENGKFVLQHRGEFGAEDNSNLQFDENGNVIYEYYWDGKEVASMEEYNRYLDSFINPDKLELPREPYEYNEILREIQKY